MVRGCLPLLYLPFPIRHTVCDESCRGVSHTPLIHLRGLVDAYGRMRYAPTWMLPRHAGFAIRIINKWLRIANLA